MRKLHVYLDEEMKSAKSEDDIKRAIKDAYNKVEQDWIKVAAEAFDKGFPKIAYVGSCALIAIVKDNKLYVANAGDSKGVLLRKKDDGSYERIKVSTTFNANKPYERERLKK
jgi:serine/threonine protein phosphatase PrpC